MCINHGRALQEEYHVCDSEVWRMQTRILGDLKEELGEVKEEIMHATDGPWRISKETKKDPETADTNGSATSATPVMSKELRQEIEERRDQAKAKKRTKKKHTRMEHHTRARTGRGRQVQKVERGAPGKKRNPANS